MVQSSGIVYPTRQRRMTSLPTTTSLSPAPIHNKNHKKEKRNQENQLQICSYTGPLRTRQATKMPTPTFPGSCVRLSGFLPNCNNKNTPHKGVLSGLGKPRGTTHSPVFMQ
ncbi:unnamed protein product [Periconia digitata]|uniref:Uncharacterized protein n=1 Tax=Periconia digitata TaxID=1303443 RepID=A0A9W4UKA9_9PLEO|nr:unnamed protein product [Periconia digitata]